MKHNRLVLLIAAFLISSLTFAHEFWLEPIKFLLKQNEKVTIHMKVGEDYQGDHSNGKKYNLTKLELYGNGKKKDIRGDVYGDSLSTVDLTIPAEGTQLVAFSNTSKFIELEGPRFNNYLRSEGLDGVLRSRAQQGDTVKAGRELYQRCVKTLVQVGSKTDDTYSIDTGMRLEIIPGKNPYTANAAGSIKFKVRFDNKPLANSLVLAWHMVDGTTTHTKLRSDKNGEVTFPIAKIGKWMISTVHMIPTPDAKQADWQSFWGSYTFGYY
ncbi:DUF4198 domain-containing protein [Persicitalea sp.]|uniref:DUF4198 domain-containing protein n=1 Tax=Persicitalea sp. TaxID=3100273 RepID=UPI003593C946